MASELASELPLVGPDTESDDSSNESAGSQPRMLRRAAVVVLSVGLGVAAVAGFAAYRPNISSANLRRRSQLWQSAIWPMQSGGDDTNTEFMDSVAGLPGIPYSEAALQELRHPVVKDEKVTTTPAPVPAIPQRAELNSNDCFQEEEFFAGACYKNCSALTAGKFPIRSSPNTCCSAEPCIFPSHISFMGPFVCTGYAVDSRGDCPRRPGKCNSDEELYQGMCYKPCGVLTAEEYPHRVGPMTCCKYEPPCFSFANLQSEGIGPCSGFDVGGEGHHCSHEPKV